MDRRQDTPTRDRVAALEARYRRGFKRLVIAFVILALGLTVVVWAQRREGIERRNETCTLFERQEKVAVDKLRRSYDLLAKRPELLKLFGVTGQQLGDMETETRAAVAPAYCDADGVGLPEPRGGDPAIPARPPALR